MRLLKKNTFPLNKCYAIGMITYKNARHIVVAAEKHDPCYLFDLSGNKEETIWDGPGGTMSIVPLAGTGGHFLASQQFYSPNDSEQARIVLVQPKEGQKWKVTTLVELPFVHRFDVLTTKDGKRYLFCSMIKSAHKHKDDWSSPGKVVACELPQDLEAASGTLKLEVVKDLLWKNHGYVRRHDDDGDYGVVAGSEGVFAIHPPVAQYGWRVEQLTSDPTSDMDFVDLDGDGQEEMIALSPFHGDTISIYALEGGCYHNVYIYPDRVDFVHSIWAGYVYGKPVAIVGHRKGKSRDILGISFENGTYRFDVLDKDVGSTNVLHYLHNGKECLVSTNREINEIAFYEIEA
jgi:hypothetical protein